MSKSPYLFESDLNINFLKAQTVDVPAFADAQFVIEAEILPNVREEEGPFAEVTGYYASREKRWVMRAKAITHRRKPVFHTILSGQEVWNAVGFTAEAKIFATVSATIPQLKAVYLTPGGCGFYGAVIQIDKDREGLGKDAIEATFKAFGPLQNVVAVDTVAKSILSSVFFTLLILVIVQVIWKSVFKKQRIQA